MNKQTIGLVIAGILVTFGAAALFLNSSNSQPPLAVAFSVKAEQTPTKTIEVKQGQTVKITFNPEINDEAHLHGYDILTDLEANKPVTTEFIADLTGEFELETEKSAQVIAVFKVSP